MTSDEIFIFLKQNDIWWDLQNLIFWKNKIDYNKTIMSTQNNLIIITGSAKQREAQMFRINFVGLPWY
jgi:hypothetical protein